MKPVTATVKSTSDDELFKTLSEELPVGVCIMQDGKFCYVNSTFPIAIGYTVDELVGRDSLDTVVPEDREIVKENTIKMLKGELRSPYQFRVTCKDGNIIWVMATVKSIEYHGRRAVLANYMEVTQRKEAEETLQTQKNKLQSLVDAMEDGITIQDRDYNVIYQGRVQRSIVGDRLGEKCYRVYGGREKVCEECPVEKAFRDGKSHTAERRMVEPSGEISFWENTANPVRDASGEIVSCLEINRNITQRKKQEQTLGDELTQRRLLFDKSLDGIVILDVDARVVEANQRFADMLGYTLEEVGELHTWDWDENFPPEQILQMGRNVDEKGLHLETRHTRKDGSLIDVDISISGNTYGGRKLVFCIQRDITDRNRAEEVLKDSEERYRELADSITDVFFAMDEKLKYTYWNKASEILTGIRAKHAIGKSIREVFPDRPWRRRAEEVYRKVLKTQRLQTFVTDYDTDDRRYILEINAYPSRGGVSAFVKDITDRKKTEEALTESEEKYRKMFEEALDAIFIADAETGVLLDCNRAACKLVGSERSELIGKHQRILHPPAEIEGEFSKTFSEHLHSQEGRVIETQVVTRTGRIKEVAIKANVVDLRGKKVIQGIFRDITERKQVQEALRKSEERYRVLADNAGEAILVVQDNVVKFINPKVVELSGYSGEELASRPFTSFIYPEDIHVVADRYLKRLQGEPVPQTYDFRIIRKDGDIRWAELDAVPISWEDRPAVLCFMSDITERKQTEEALRQSEEKYRTILEETGDGYFETDLAGNVTFVNEALINLLGYSREEIAGMDFRALRPKEEGEAVFKAYNRMYKTGEPLRNFPSEVICKDGRHLFAETSAFPIRNDRGTIVGFRGVRRDITARTQMEEALRHSEEKYRTILEEMEDAYFEVDLGGHLTFVNSSVCRDLGYSREELIGKSYKAFTVDDDTEPLFQVFNEVYRTGVPNKGFPWSTVRKDGSHGIAETSISLLRNRQGETIGFRGVGRDITERKLAEERLRQSEENYRALFDSSVIGTIVLDAETGKAVMANAAAAKIFGFSSPQEGLGRNPLDFVAPEDRENVLEAIKTDLFEQDVRRTGHFRAVTKSGREIWLSVTAARIMHDGRLAGLISFADITEQKLQDERLMITDRLASIGELAAGTAHELNNPLTSIIGFSQLLMERELPDGIREDLKLIDSEAQRAASVTRNLLTFARKHTPVKEPNQLNNVIEDVLKLREHEHKVNCIEVKKRLASDLPRIMVDYYQMQQVFLNIIINAEYSMTEAHSKGTLTITTNKQNGHVMASFADDGLGISPENLSRIFDPFFTTKEAGKGTGLGLSICHGIVAEHGGQISAKSQPGEGATISIELPINGNNHVEATL
jgi:two-component system NtrC family sensor kinase